MSQAQTQDVKKVIEEQVKKLHEAVERLAKSIATEVELLYIAYLHARCVKDAEEEMIKYINDSVKTKYCYVAHMRHRVNASAKEVLVGPLIVCKLGLELYTDADGVIKVIADWSNIEPAKRALKKYIEALLK
jgi:hypothetical protein